MALMTGEQYIESIKKIKMEIYMFGERYNNPTESPILRPSLNSVRMTYDLAQMPEYEDLMTAVSPYTGRRVNRFTHIHQSAQDLVKKVKMQRLLASGVWVWTPSTPSTPPPMRLTRSTAPATMRTSINLLPMSRRTT